MNAPETKLLRVEDRRLLTGQGRFVGDIHLDRMVHAAFVRSPHAHATIEHVDAEPARAVPGVIAVYTAADLTERDQTVRAVAGSSVVYLLVGLKYDLRVWQDM